MLEMDAGPERLLVDHCNGRVAHPSPVARGRDPRRNSETLLEISVASAAADLREFLDVHSSRLGRLVLHLVPARFQALGYTPRPDTGCASEFHGFMHLAHIVEGVRMPLVSRVQRQWL